MSKLFSQRVPGWARAVLLVVGLLAGLSLRPQAAQASHLRAGDIRATLDTTVGPTYNARRVFFRMVIYTDNTSPVKADKATIFYGDGTSSCYEGVPRSGPEIVIPTSPGVSVNIFYFEHIYPVTGQYTVSYVGENRNGTVINMSRPADQTFYISTTFLLDPALARNRTPVLRAPAIDRGAVGQVFLHNPAAYDADGDSLSYRLLPSQQVAAGIYGTLAAPCTIAGGGVASGNNRPVVTRTTNFRFPNDPLIAPNPVQVPYGGTPTGVPLAAAIFEINPRTGQMTWNAPISAGEYNVAFRVVEWRRTPLGYDSIGSVIRDMQIVVSATNNIRPTIFIPTDLCVVAGTTVSGVVTAVDGTGPGSTAQTPITLFAYSGILPPATFVQSTTGPPQARGTFTWRTECNNVAKEPYLVVFKAQDGPNPPTPTNPILIDERVWRITVVGPPPQNLQATPLPGTGGGVNGMRVTWNPYTCSNARYIYIYRKVDQSTFSPSGCITGIPASAGYVLVKRVDATDVSFDDYNADATNTRRGLDRGRNYCYRIYADFQLPAGGESLASNEACATIAGRAALLTNVDVTATSPTAGRITVRWTRPRSASGTAFDGSPAYVLSRAEGLNPAATAFAAVSAPITNLNDTTYVDAGGTTGLNTEAKQYTYKLEFVRTVAGASVTEASPTASSVYVQAVPANVAASAVTVSWTFQVPWDNTAQPTTIYRRTGLTGTYAAIGTASSTTTGGTYTDRDASLVKGQTYYYYVQTNGRYASFSFLSSLLNKSQERRLVLLALPCTPVLTLQPTNCDSLAGLQSFPRPNERYANRLRWSLGNTPAGCDATVTGYRLYYRPTPTGAFTLLTTTTATSYLHQDLTFSGGCYAVQAVAPSGVVSDTSNVACQDNCVFFSLPNIFTPNGDAQNAVFRPKTSSAVARVHFQAFNRWGVKVFENTTTSADPILINWDGGGPVSENAASKVGKSSDGVYFYLAEVEFADFAHTKRTYKGWVEIVR